MAVFVSRSADEALGACVIVENEWAQVWITLDYGPRIARYCLRDGRNVFLEDPSGTICNEDARMAAYYGPGAKWCSRGGHRLWVSPERMPETYYPDNGPVNSVRFLENGAEIAQEEQTENGVCLSIKVTMDSDSPRVTVVHTIKNTGTSVKTMAPWAISVMASGGLQIFEMSAEETEFLPNHSLVLWPYTDLQDPRLFAGKQFITLRHDPSVSPAIKIGVRNEAGYGAYLNQGFLFVKRSEPISEQAIYPDMGSTYEAYANGAFTEMETIGPLREVAPSEAISLTEWWDLKRVDVFPDPRNETELRDFANYWK